MVSRRSPCVLVVDDDQSNRQAMRIILEDAGYVVEEAADGAAALERLRASKERLIVALDLVLPGMNGVAVLQAVVADQTLATRHAYILLTAAVNLPPALPDLLARLHAPLLPKPFDINCLLEMVAAAAAPQLDRSPTRSDVHTKASSN